MLLHLICIISAVSSFRQQCPNQGPNTKLLHHNRSSHYNSSRGCEQPTMADLRFLLYTRKNVQTPIILNPIHPQINPSKPIKIIFHGWISSPFFYGMQPLKDAYLNRYDCNVILVDWSAIAQEDYLLSVCKVPGLGKLVAQMLCGLETAARDVIADTHIMGHSLGGQLIGFVGKFTKILCGKTLGRITGLDPAGPAYQNVSASDRLNKTDASFVDVLHVNMGSPGEGFYGALGDVDFYINCGVVQPGCILPNRAAESALEIETCSHFRVLDLMTESVNSYGFVGISCKSCPVRCRPDATDATSVVMGENCPKNAPEGAYYVKTGKCPPYAASP